jgi:hypothetical protein
MAQSYTVIDPSINPEDIRDAIPERTAITTDWMGLQLQAARQRVESQRSDKGQTGALSNTTKKDTELASEDQKHAIQEKEYSFSGANSAFLQRLMSSVPTPVTGASDKENNAPMFEQKHGERKAPSRFKLATKVVTFSDDRDSSSSSEETDTEAPRTMGELVASFGVRQTRHASYPKSL